jgi:phosphoribosylformimino-5-aminoimidazole carboxamide ribotide isomerase
VLVIPSLDLSGGRVVRLVRGDFGRETTYAESEEEALALAGRLARAGARRLHVVDLDGARGTGDNRPLVERLVGEARLEVQVAGGVRSPADAAAWLESGAAAVVMGTAAVRQPERLAETAAAYPGRVLAALDVRDGRPAVQGWLEVEETALGALLRRWGAAPLAGVVLTSVDRDGTLAGPDLDLLREALAASAHPVAYSGGVRSLEELRALEAAGAAAVILGRSLLEGLIPLGDALALSSSSPP